MMENFNPDGQKDALIAARFDHAHNANQALIADTQARHEAGQAVMKNPKLAHLMAIMVTLDERGFESVFNCAMNQQRYSKGN